MFFPHSIFGKVWREKTKSILQKPMQIHKSYYLRQRLVTLYLLDVLNVVSDSILKLRTTPRKNKIITGLSHPVLVLLVLNKLWVRYIVIPYLNTHRTPSLDAEVHNIHHQLTLTFSQPRPQNGKIMKILLPTLTIISLILNLHHYKHIHIFNTYQNQKPLKQLQANLTKLESSPCPCS